MFIEFLLFEYCSGAGGRTFQPRSQHRNQNEEQVECWDDIDTNTQFNNGKTGKFYFLLFFFYLWFLMICNVADNFPSPEDWDNEEYTGSLADTKVFTPSENPVPETDPNVPSAPGNQQYLSDVQVTAFFLFFRILEFYIEMLQILNYFAVFECCGK